jgi:hypothetical protein
LFVCFSRNFNQYFFVSNQFATSENHRFFSIASQAGNQSALAAQCHKRWLQPWNWCVYLFVYLFLIFHTETEAVTEVVAPPTVTPLTTQSSKELKNSSAQLSARYEQKVLSLFLFVLLCFVLFFVFVCFCLILTRCISWVLDNVPLLIFRL